MMWSFYYWLQSSRRWSRPSSGLPNPAQSGFSPGSFINRERDRVPWRWQSCEMLGTEAAGGYVFNIWKKWVIENTCRLREAQTRAGEPQKVHISLYSRTDGLAILWSFYTTCINKFLFCSSRFDWISCHFQAKESWLIKPENVNQGEVFRDKEKQVESVKPNKLPLLKRSDPPAWVKCVRFTVRVWLKPA